MMYLIPANSKDGKLIFGVFTRFDLILVTLGLIVSILLVIIMQPESLQNVLLCCAPGGICVLLVIPVPNYHNIYTVLKELIEFFYNRRNYKWEGWCDRDEYK